MSIDLEDQLRQAYGQLPDASADPTDVLARSRRTAVRSRRHRTAGVCAGTVAAALAVGVVTIGGPLITSPGRDAGILPAGGSTGTPTFATHNATTPTATEHSSTGTTAHHTAADEGSDKPFAGLSGKLLPHGSQLPAGLAYRGHHIEDANKSWHTSPANGSNVVTMPVQVLIVAKQARHGITPAQTRARYGIVGSVWDMASTTGSDLNPSFRASSTSIVRFRTPAFAQDAIGKAQRKEGGLYWVKPTMTKPNVPWSGVPGFSGDHGVYDCAGWAPTPNYVAYQVVGEYIVSVDASTAPLAEQAVTDTVGNLKTAGLLK